MAGVIEGWRLIQDRGESGPWNMGIDEAMLRNAAESGLATLRLYTWSGSWLSLGYAQRRMPPERLEAWRRAGVEVVRRTTGGRAVLHGRDLTYSIAAPESALLAGLQGAYDQIAGALLIALHSLGVVEAERAPTLAGPPGSSEFDCFARPAGDEIVLGGRKLIGSAQRRRGGVVLQHGSIRLTADLPEVLAAAGVAQGLAVSLEEAGHEIEEEILRGALVRSFGAALGCEFSERRPEPWERRQAEIRCEKHHRDLLSAPSGRKP